MRFVDRFPPFASSPFSAICIDHELHVDYLCKRWHCANEDRKIIYNHIKQKASDDNVGLAHRYTEKYAEGK